MMLGFRVSVVMQDKCVEGFEGIMMCGTLT